MHTYVTQIIEPSHTLVHHTILRTRIIELTQTTSRITQDATSPEHMPIWFRTRPLEAYTKAHVAHMSMLRNLRGRGEKRVEVWKDRGSGGIWIAQRKR
jgi:hypothetical protein